MSEGAVTWAEARNFEMASRPMLPSAGEVRGGGDRLTASGLSPLSDLDMRQATIEPATRWVRKVGAHRHVPNPPFHSALGTGGGGRGRGKSRSAIDLALLSWNRGRPPASA